MKKALHNHNSRARLLVFHSAAAAFEISKGTGKFAV